MRFEEGELEAYTFRIKKKKKSNRENPVKAKNKTQELKTMYVLSGDFKRQAGFISGHGCIHVPGVYGFTWNIDTFYLSFIKIAYNC